VGSWGAKGTQTIVLLVLAKALAPADFGILAIAALTYNVLQALNQMGVADALTYLQDRIDEASRTALSMVLAAGLVLMAGTWVLAPMIASFFHIAHATFVLRGFALGLPFDAAAEVPVGRLTRSLRFSRRAMTDTLPSVIGAVVTIGVVVSGYPLIGLVAGQVVGSVANAAVAMLLGPRCLPGWNATMARRLLRYGGFLSGADLINLGLLNVDYIVVGHVLGPVALGFYSLAYRICFMPYLSIAVVANGAAFPYFCRLPSRDAIARAAENTFGLINALSIPWFAGLVLFAGDISLLGHKWAPAAPAVRFLALYGLFLSLTLSALQVLKAVGRADLVFLGRGLHLVILTAVLIFTVHLGITVVAIDQALVACAIALTTGLWIVRQASLRPGALARSVALPMLGVLGMVVAVFVLGRIPWLGATPSWTSLLILGPLALAVFALISLAIMPALLRQGWTALRGRSVGVTELTPQPASRSTAPRALSLGSRALSLGSRALSLGSRALSLGSRAPGAGNRSPLLAGAVLLAVASGAAIIVGNWAELTFAGIVAVIVLGLILCRLDLAVAVLAVSFFFNAYLAHGAGIITADKVLGALAVMAWGLDWAVNRRPVLGSRQLWLIGAFLLWTGLSIVVAVDDRAALVTSLRYVTFATLYFLVLQTVRGDRRRADGLVKVVVIAAAVASVIGLIAFFSHHVARASGPINDPNDLGFVLASSLPLAIYQVRWGATRWGKALWSVAVVLILACTLATFSRSALAGLAAAGIWAVAARRLRIRWLLAVAACLAAVVGAAWLVAPQLVRSALGQKSYVATHNVSTRIGYYHVELNEFEHYPITGVGPGNFVYRFYQFAPAAGESLPFPSDVLTISGEEAYLVILAEQGAVGLALFVGYLALSWADLRRRFPADQRTDHLQAALAAGFLVACVGALFLAEQYYPPLWFLPALAASMASSLSAAGAGPPAGAGRAGDSREARWGSREAAALVPGRHL
jgi:O-antigen/teichoic acid export membrane protein